MTSISSGLSQQPYLYSGKELDRMHALDWYDYGARHYDAALLRWYSMDPLCEKYYHISPYAFCANKYYNESKQKMDNCKKNCIFVATKTLVSTKNGRV